MTTLVVQAWEESEIGWGVDEDGWSVHETTADLKDYIANYWASMPAATPSVYSRPTGSPQLIEASDELVDKVKASEYGIRTYKKEW